MDAGRVIRRLRELDERSGARRVAWTDVWEDERRRLEEDLRADVPGVSISRDEAGNLWAASPAEGARVVVGSHIDCVPGGGWLDGCLGVLAAAEALRTIDGPLTLVDWADEEGARFGHSLLGSSAAAGLLDVEHAASLVDADGVTLPDTLAAHGVELARAPHAASRLENVRAYVELHIEQGPILDEEELPAAAVDGCLGVRRRELVFPGQAAHAGATPLRLRLDPVLAASRFALELRSIAERHGGLATIGSLRAEPGTPTAVPESVRLTIDLRHHSLDALEAMASDAAAAAGDAESHDIWSIDPIRFDPGLVARAAALVPDGRTLTSGPLHDAAAVARAGIPTVMLFARTRGGISHSREEDAREEDLVVAIEAFGELVRGLLPL